MSAPPLNSERIIDFTLGLSLFFSDNERENKFGEYVKDKWEAICEKYKGDKSASKYFDEINAAMAATVNHLAQSRKETNQGFAFLDSLQKRRMEGLDDLARLSRDAESIATRLSGLTIGGGLSFLGLATNVFGAREIAIVIIGAGLSYIGLEVALRLYKNYKAPKIMEEIKKEKEKLLKEQLEPKSKEIIAEFLKKINQITENIYGTKYKIEAGVITVIAQDSATLQSGSYFTSGSIPTHPYYGGEVGAGYHGGAFDNRLYSEKILRTNYDKENSDQ